MPSRDETRGTARPAEEAAGGDERLPVNKESAIRVVAPLPADMRPVSRSRKAGRRERCRDLHRRKWTAVEDIEALAIPANAGGHKRGYQSTEGSVLARLRPAWRFLPVYQYGNTSIRIHQC